jgi:hypothetical protein
MAKTKRKVVVGKKKQVKASKSASNFSTPDDLSAVKSSWSEEGIICCVRAKLYNTYNDAIKLSKKCKLMVFRLECMMSELIRSQQKLIAKARKSNVLRRKAGKD